MRSHSKKTKNLASIFGDASIFLNRLSGNTPAEINSQKLEELINKEHGDTTPQPPVNPEPTEGSAPAPKI